MTRSELWRVAVGLFVASGLCRITTAEDLPLMHELRGDWHAGKRAIAAGMPRLISIKLLGHASVDDRACTWTAQTLVASRAYLGTQWRIRVSCKEMTDIEITTAIYASREDEPEGFQQGDETLIIFGTRPGTPLVCKFYGLPEGCSVPISFAYYSQHGVDRGGDDTPRRMNRPWGSK